MRIAVTGDREFLDEVASELPASDAVRVERIDDATDDGDLAFSLAEVGTLVGTVVNLVSLCRTLIEVRRRNSAPTQKLRFKTALGTMEVELPHDITLETLHSQLASLVRE
jgi:hypothetical protein